jgi:hypothetical protein
MAKDDGSDLQDFLSAAGDSLSSAHQQLGTGLEFITGMALASADLEVKAAVHSQGGRLSITTLPADEVRLSEVNPDLLSTVKLSFVATSLDEDRQTGAPSSRLPTPVPVQAAPPPSSQASQRPQTAVEAEVRQRTEIQELGNIFGELRLRSAYVPALERWLVLVESQDGLLLRELVLPDRPAGQGGDG